MFNIDLPRRLGLFMGMSEYNYKAAGVDTEKAQDVVKQIAQLRVRTETKHQLYQSFGLFAAGMDLSGYKEPVIFTACDGVGTKIRPLLDHGLLPAAGVDLVAMNVNDLLCCNAMPLMFLDYIGIASLNETWIAEVIEGIVQGLEQCECVLAGGETAEMPGLVHEDLIELSGFCVGVAEKPDLVDPSQVSVGDLLVGVPSNGFHANGWSLIRKVLAEHEDHFSESDRRSMLSPTRIYFKEVVAMNAAGVPIHAMAHITGGGLRENVERVLNGFGASFRIPGYGTAPEKKVVDIVGESASLQAFNMGIGYVFIIPETAKEAALAALPDASIVGTVCQDPSINIEVVG